MGKFVDRTGLEYGSLTVTGREDAGPASKGRRVMWRCQCLCGNTVVVTGHALAAGDTKSCGCLRKQKVGSINRSHALSRKPVYRSWQAMKSRCENPNDTHYANYGGRGISVCPEWSDSFERFYLDMGDRPAGMTIDRRNNDLGYFKDNCRWATHSVQSNNKRTNILWNNESLSIKQLAERMNVPRTSLNKLLKRGMCVEDAVVHAVTNRKLASM